MVTCLSVCLLVAGFQTRTWIRGTLDQLVSPDRHSYVTDTAERADLPLCPQSLHRNRSRIEAEKKKEEIEVAKMTVQVMAEAQATLAKLKVLIRIPCSHSPLYPPP